MNVVAYCRVSTDKRDQLNSLETQKTFFEEYAQKMNYNLLHIYSDPGRSGTKIQKREDFQKMLTDAKTGDFSLILVKDVSRFARNTVDALEVVRELKAIGVKVQFISSQMDSLGDSEFLLAVMSAIAQEESYNISKRIKFSKKFNAQKGRVPNLVYGYDKIEEDYFHMNINEKEAEIVKKIFHWYIEEGDGTMKISQRLNAMGIKTKRGSKWTNTAVARILGNPIYIGKITNGKEEIINFPNSKRVRKENSEHIIVQNEEMRILSDEIFQKAQAILAKRAKDFHQNKDRHSNKYLFSTLIKCKECGWSFRRVVKSYKNTYIRWVCSGRNGHGADTCKNAVSVDENELITFLQAYFASLLTDRYATIERAITLFHEQQYSLTKNDENNIESIKKKISELKTTRDRTLALFTEGYLTKDEVEERIGYIKTELPRLEHEFKRLSVDKPSEEEIKQKYLDTFRNIENITDIRNMTNADLKKIINKITVDYEGHIDIYLNVFDENANRP